MLNGTAQGNHIRDFPLQYDIESPRGKGALLRRLADALEDAENECRSRAARCCGNWATS